MKKRRHRASATTEQLLLALHRAYHDYRNSESYQRFVAAIQTCPENAGCSEAFEKLTAFHGEQNLTETLRTDIEAAAERWERLRDYCPHCSSVVERNRKTDAYQNYKKIQKRVSRRLGVPPATVMGIQIQEEK